MTTGRLDELCANFIAGRGGVSAPLNYRGFPKSICTSVNHVVCHGIPGDKVLQDGDVINIDVTPIVDGWHGDTSRMFWVGDVSIKSKRLIDVTYEAMMKGIEAVRPGATVGDIGHAIEEFVAPYRYSIVRDFLRPRGGADLPRRAEHSSLRQSRRGPGPPRGDVLHRRADGERRPPRGQNPRRRLDGGDQGPLALGPVRAHHRGDRRGPRDLHYLAGRPRQAALRLVFRAGVEMPGRPAGAKPSKSPRPHYAGHRARLRERFLKSGRRGPRRL